MTSQLGVVQCISILPFATSLAYRAVDVVANYGTDDFELMFFFLTKLLTSFIFTGYFSRIHLDSFSLQ